MPVEGHAERLVTPLRRRDRIVLAVAGLGSLAAVAVLVGVWVFGGSTQSNAGCVVASIPSTMGGATVRRCGRAAHDLCRTEGRVDRSLAEACVTQGFAADVPRMPPG